MNKLILALALMPALLPTGAFAQSVDEPTSKQMWCGTALSIYYSNPPAGASEDDLAKAKVFLDGTSGMIAEATQKYLDAGFTEEQVTKVKTDLTADLTKIVTGKDESGKTVSEPPAAQPPYSFNDCLTLLQARLPADAASSSASQ